MKKALINFFLLDFIIWTYSSLYCDGNSIISAWNQEVQEKLTALDASEIISDIFKFESEKLTIVALSALIWVITFHHKKQNYITKIIHSNSGLICSGQGSDRIDSFWFANSCFAEVNQESQKNFDFRCESKFVFIHVSESF